ncbi:MAG: MBL fold metallo-hydrolase [Planctomycetota bacterium]|jgi:ribonuclease Z|nr:MBL fold metallo-hydrolase [Planctomycetota bacterium]
MHLTFLGTSSGTPTRERNVSGMALTFDDGAVWVVDCGEGTQHQILRTAIRPGRIEAILLTHLHGDHCYGLPGLLASLAVHGRSDDVAVVGPKGVAEWLAVTTRISSLRLAFTWRVVEIDSPGLLDLSLARATVSALPLVHRVESYAYHITEPNRRGKVDAARAHELGVGGSDIGRLAAGHTVTTSDGTLVDPSMVVGVDRPGRRVVLCGDSADSSGLLPEAIGCDLLVHECTFAADRADHARQWGHSTAPQVGALAAQLQPKQLILTHLSSRYSDGAGPNQAPDDLRADCAAQCPGVPVSLAQDLQVIDIPRC